jgi:hypothetical protein
LEKSLKNNKKIILFLVIFNFLITPVKAEYSYVRGDIFHLLSDPNKAQDGSYQWIKDGV